MSEPYPVTGASKSGAVYPRLEIRDLVQKPEQFSLFIRAWLNIRNPNNKDVPLPAQHVQIGGIHGLPHTKWPGDPKGTGDSDADWQGYCNHRSVLFPTWHRPYVMLLEQSIWNEAQNVLKNSNVKPETAAAWKQAAKELRFPFWDWTLPITGKEGLPRIFYEPTLTLQMPDGTTSTVENILAYYDFGNQGLPAGFQNVQETNPVAPGIHVSYFARWTRTYRWPNSVPTNVVESYNKLNEVLTSTDPNRRGSYPEFMGKVAQLFSYPPNDSRSSIIWDQFSNDRGQSKVTHDFGLSSLEQPHNTLHLVIGGSGGNMMDNDYAGFDPIFFMHHCNVDRLLAFWEHAYPSYWMGRDGFPTSSGNKPFTQIYGTYSEPNYAVINEVSELTPYRKPDGNYWNGNDTRFVGSTGFPKYYTYPDLNGVSLDKQVSAAERDRDLKLLQDYFGQKPTAQRNRQKVLIKQPLFSNDNVEALPHDNEPVYNFRQFAILVELAEHAFGGSHFLEVLYTSKDGQTHGVGATAVLSRSHDTQCPGCIGRRHENIKLRDSIHVPHDVIFKIITDHDLNHENIGDEEFTKAISGNFHAQIVTPGGLVLARAVYGQRRSQPGLTGVDEAIVPKLRFASANVCADKHRQGDEEIHPWQFYDWKDHGAVLENEWVNAESEA